jgi:hypothetical protein
MFRPFPLLIALMYVLPPAHVQMQGSSTDHAVRVDAEHVAGPVPDDDTKRSSPFKIGERLVFSIEYGFVTAGEATMSVVGVDTINGHPSFHLQTLARTNEIFSTFYNVNDRVESHLDMEGLFSRHFVKSLREGSYKKDLEVYFDQEGGYAHYVDGDSIPALPMTQDVLSAFFYLRTRDLSVGKTYSFPCQDNRKNYPLIVKVLRREKVLVPAGKFDCYVVEPRMRTGGLMKKEAKMKIWLTADERKMPVRMETKMKIGSIAAKLQEYKVDIPGSDKDR